TFASGLAAGGMIPVVCIYSTFMQRAVDQIIHDVALQNLHVVLVFDRAGVVPQDGETHQGMYDIALMRSIPNVSILAPCSAKDLEYCLAWAVEECNGPVVIRYPKSSCPSQEFDFAPPVSSMSATPAISASDFGSASIEPSGSVKAGFLVPCSEFAASLSPAENKKTEKKILFVCTGGFFSETLNAARILLMKDIETDLYVLRFIKPFNYEELAQIAKKYDGIVIAEDGVALGGIGEEVKCMLLSEGIKNVTVKAFPDRFLAHGNRSEICADCGMSPEDLAQAALDLLK
ncbi:MAG: 1-deoxy-D-xylulose-5-phosphate synthase, partial [Treponema sp.]|nr:1-deoxy-D-xylulose-5-phosphate synthase [Treponema sp.]